MANVKITNLPSLTGASSASDDVLPVVDISTDTTSKMTRAEFFKNVPSPSLTGQVSLDDGSAAAPSLTNTGDLNTGLFFPAEDTVGLGTGGTERLRVDAFGRFLVGTTTGVGGDFTSVRFNSGGSYPQALNMVDSNASASGSVFQVFRKSDDTYLGNIRRNSTDNAIFVGGNSYLALGSGDTERMRIDASGNLGLGVTPSAWDTVKPMQLANGSIYGFSTTDVSVAANMYLSSGAFRYISTGSVATQYLQTSGQHRWLTAPSGTAGNAITFTQAMTLDGSGRLLLGTTSAPAVASMLTLSAPAGTLYGTFNAVAQTYSYLTMQTSGTDFGYIGPGALDLPSSMSIVAAGARSLTLGTNGTERMRIDASGNLGIGTDTYASARVHINSTSPSGFEDTGNTLRLTCSASSTAAAGATGAGLVFAQQWLSSGGGLLRTGGIYGLKTAGDGNFGGGLAFYTQPNAAVPMAERMRIDASGDLLLGTTSAIDPNGARFVNAYAFPKTGAEFSTNSSFAHSAITFRNANGLVGSINTTGSATSYNTSSDYRLKENVAPMQNALDTVAQLNPVTYTWKADGSDGQGFIAHELQAIVPDCVSGEKDAVDDEGNPKYQGVDTSFLVATLVKAIQELKAEVDSLRAQLNP